MSDQPDIPHNLITDVDVSVVIPVKAYSQRVHNKNWKYFYEDKCLLDIKILQVMRVIPKNKIFIYSDTEKALEIAAKYGVLGYIYGTTKLDWPETFYNIVMKVKSQYVMRAAVTTPFIGSSIIRDMIQTFILNEKQYDSIVAVERIQSRILDAKGQPYNFGEGIPFHQGGSKAHKQTQDLSPIFAEKPGVSMLPTETARKIKYGYGDRPYLFEIPALEIIDINTPDDWEAAQLLLTSDVIKHYFNWDLG